MIEGAKTSRWWEKPLHEDVLIRWKNKIQRLTDNREHLHQPTFGMVCAYIFGFSDASNDAFLPQFVTWLKAKPEHAGFSNVAFQFLILMEATGQKQDDGRVRWKSERELSYPEDHELVIDHLLLRMSEFLAITASELGFKNV